MLCKARRKRLKLARKKCTEKHETYSGVSHHFLSASNVNKFLRDDISLEIIADSSFLKKVIKKFFED